MLSNEGKETFMFKHSSSGMRHAARVGIFAGLMVVFLILFNDRLSHIPGILTDDGFGFWLVGLAPPITVVAASVVALMSIIAV
jgi:hypothetical protein